MTSSSNNDRLTANEMRERGYVTVKVEHYQWYPGMDRPRKRDFLGWADFFCWNEEEDILVQTTSRSNHAARRNKILESNFFLKWIKNPNHKVLVQTWDKYKGKWRVKDEFITRELYDEYMAKKKAVSDKKTKQMSGWSAEDFQKALLSNTAPEKELSLGPIHQKALDNRPKIEDLPF